MSKESKSLRIDIVSDIVCPFCFVGKRRMESALKKLPDDIKVTVNWKPFFLEPSAPAPGIDKMEFYLEKFGKERVAKMIPYMKEQGAKVGIKFSYGGKIGNTLDSHRLVNLAKQKGKGDEMVERLFQDYFEKERDISDLKVLNEAAGSLEIDAKEVLESEDYIKEVNEEVYDSHQMGISGVPFYIVNNSISLSGVQETETWDELMRELGYLEKSKEPGDKPES
mmetsp:Transcript_20352/g.49976  ORF Transcript_20352/g.49976 Transcript_20352/m.49976 type:complete len:223 (-) Transcript_20352:140-808(-)|eukprot:CAMPEP_0114530360 /NCGR_PEP_ID=MMETSP0109-20121206/25399_1 /TAXON_ID=29199 /ORGANISM="Chlorarachnion reptans, Strain CCCM449" /LENGTH=222 /DNA_ID=CAMNT_0001712969 /DNA_START=196 /DNA_END=864 /DNA_ORIENTATION=+